MAGAFRPPLQNGKTSAVVEGDEADTRGDTSGVNEGVCGVTVLPHIALDGILPVFVREAFDIPIGVDLGHPVPVKGSYRGYGVFCVLLLGDSAFLPSCWSYLAVSSRSESRSLACRVMVERVLGSLYVY